MGVDTVIHLPPHVDDDDVCEIMAICAGAQATRRNFTSGPGWSAEVPGIRYEAEGHGRFPNLVSVWFKDPRDHDRHVVYFCRAGDLGGPLLRPRSSPFWIAIGRRLLRVFGGQMTYRDHTDEISESVDPQDALLTPEDCKDGNNEGFYKRQNALMSALPLSPEELLSADEEASYRYEIDKNGAPCGEAANAELGAFRALHERLALSETTAPAPAAAPDKPARKSRSRKTL